MYESNDLIIQLSFLIYSNPGVYALLLGSGISRSAGIPTGNEITLDLANKLSTMIEKKEVEDVSKWCGNPMGKPMAPFHISSQARRPSGELPFIHG